MNYALGPGLEIYRHNETFPALWIQVSQIWGGILATTGVLGNSLTIVIFMLYMNCSGQSRPPSPNANAKPSIPLEGYTILLLNLSVCDLLYCSVNLPLTVFTYSHASPIGPTQELKSFCSGAAFFRYTTALIEWESLALITILQCINLRRQKDAHLFRPRKTLICIAVIWISSIIPHLSYFFIADNAYGYDYETFKCDILNPTVRLIFFSFESLIPCIVMFAGCTGIIYQIWRNVENLKKCEMMEDFVRRRRKEMVQSVALSLTLLMVFTVCVIPVCLYNVVTILSDEPNVPVGITLFMVYWIQYVLNFFLYICRNDSFRKSFKHFFATHVGSLAKGLRPHDSISVSLVGGSKASTLIQGSFNSGSVNGSFNSMLVDGT